MKNNGLNIKSIDFRRVGIVLFLLTSFVCKAQQIPNRPSPPRLVNDFTNTLSYAQTRNLEHKLVSYSDTTSTQIAVVFVNDLQGTTIADYTYKLGEKWGVGTKKNNGIVILIKPKNNNGNGQVNISVGYGLEPFIPDALAKRIIEKEMIPAFQMNDYYTGVNKAIDVIIGLASGTFSKEEYSSNDNNFIVEIILVLFLIIVPILLIKVGSVGNTYSSKQDESDIWRALFWTSFLSSHNRHNSHNHWDKFSGGSGSFGGGGFGGFGGGSFGGGGASGSW